MAASSAVIVGVGGCGAETNGDAADAAEDQDSAGSTPPADTDASDTVVADTAPREVGPAEYCETTAPFFCDYYLRCGLMAVAGEPACLAVFDQRCNLVFEPQYRRLAAAGRLALSGAGIDACAAHLASVPCEAQLNDLDGDCGAMWVGLLGEGETCGPGIESLVCDADHTCVLGLDFCGTCRAAAPVGGGCAVGGPRCHAAASCVDGTCVARPRVGELCDDALPCVVGADCVDGACAPARTTVTVGEPCDQVRRCQYKAACVGGRCVEAALNGEPCDAAVPCAAGACLDGVCREAAPAELYCPYE